MNGQNVDQNLLEIHKNLNNSDDFVKMAASNSTFYQLLDIYQKSRNMGLVASLTMETRKGQDIIKRKKTPSQLRRENYLKKKTDAAKEASDCHIKVKPENVTPVSVEPVDEIN